MSGDTADLVNFEVIAPAGQSLDAVVAATPLRPFSSEAVSFLGDLSAALLQSSAARAFPELMALGFWMRPASVRRLAARFEPSEPTSHRPTLLRARGTAFHIAPSNVDTIFVYSWMISLLAGNANIVRLSRKTSPQTEALLSIVQSLIEHPEHAAVRDRTLLVRFDPSHEATSFFSLRCDVRVVWGGDATVNEIRKAALPPLATEIVFGDRFSVAVVDAKAWLESESGGRDRAIRGFVNDTYWFMQLACSSPRLVTWVGGQGDTSAARTDFWARVRTELAGRNLGLSAREFISKRAAAAGLAVVRDVRFELEDNEDLTRVWVESPATSHHEWHCGGGLFWEAGVANLDDLAPYLDRRVQTVAHFGLSIERIRDFVTRCQPRGGDRWVAFGKSLDFDEIWDGFDLVAALGRWVTLTPER